jgi:hypothetical protein
MSRTAALAAYPERRIPRPGAGLTGSVFSVAFIMVNMRMVNAGAARVSYANIGEFSLVFARFIRCENQVKYKRMFELTVTLVPPARHDVRGTKNITQNQ